MEETSSIESTQDAVRRSSAHSIPLVTLALIVCNVLVFVLMGINGISLIDPSPNILKAWGANYGPMTTAGEWWRLITATFVHIGIFHLIINMYVLFSVGAFLELLLGKATYLQLYFLSGIAESIASLAWNPYVASAGASSAVFGLYGSFIALLITDRSLLEAEVAKGILKGALVFIGFNLLNSLRPGVDMAGHVGGLIGGFVLGLSTPVSPMLARRGALAAIGILALIMVRQTWSALPDFDVELQRLYVTEDKVFAAHNELMEAARSGAVNDADFSDRIVRQIVPAWQDQRMALDIYDHLPRELSKVRRRLVGYMDGRLEGWKLMEEGARKGDAQMIEQGITKHQEAEKTFATKR